MKKLIKMLMMLLATPVIAQSVDSSFVTVNIENEVYAIDYDASKDNVFKYLLRNNVAIQNQTEYKDEIVMNFILNQQQYKSYDSLLIKLGYSTSKQIKTVNNYTKISEINLELTYLKQKRDSYNELIKSVDKQTTNYFSLWNEQKLIEEKIFLKERELLTLNKKGNYYYIKLELKNETTSPENTRVSFVNMPGLEYSFLKIESPLRGVSADYYNGYFLKYLFTKGKSYATLGVYKNNNLNATDSAAFSELFIIGFGQDFYSRYAGRGTRKYFNLYSGYTIGTILATGDTTKSNIFYLAPSVGLELFKNKYMLIDTKVAYFTPLLYNRNLRGVSGNISFNFVF